jgi:hypothetical protein
MDCRTLKNFFLCAKFLPTITAFSDSTCHGWLTLLLNDVWFIMCSPFLHMVFFMFIFLFQIIEKQVRDSESFTKKFTAFNSHYCCFIYNNFGFWVLHFLLRYLGYVICCRQMLVISSYFTCVPMPMFANQNVSGTALGVPLNNGENLT